MAVFQSPFGGVTVEVFDKDAEANYRAAGWDLVAPVKKSVEVPRANARRSSK